MALSSKALEPDNSELCNSLKLSSTNIQHLCYNFVGCESFIESSLLESIVLTLCEKNLEDTNESSNFYVKGYLPSIRKDFVTHIHNLASYVKVGVSFARNCLLKTLKIPIFVFNFIQ